MTERIRELFDAVNEDPSNRAASDELEALLREQESWSELTELYVHLAEHETSAEARTTFLRNAAVIARDALDDPGYAVRLLSASLEGDEVYVLETLDEMRRLLAEIEDWENWIDVATALAERLEDVGQRAALIHEMGVVLEQAIGDRERAMECYQAAFQTDTSQLDSLAAARRIYEEDGNWDMVSELLRLELGHVEGDRRVEVLRNLGTVHQEQLNQPEDALALFEEVLRLAPGDADAQSRVNALRPNEPAPDATIESVPDDEEEALDPAALADHSAADLEAMAANEAGARRHLLLSLAAAALGDGGLAELPRVYLAAAEADPAGVEIYWRVARELSAPDETLQAIATGLDSLAESNSGGQGKAFEAHRLLFGAAHLGEARTVDFKLRELAKSKDSGVITWQVQRLAEAGKWRNVQQALAQQIGGKPGDARTEALRRMARMAEQRLGDSKQAGDFWSQVFRADKTDREARKALSVIYEQNGKWKELIAVLQLEVDEVPDSQTDEKLAQLRRLADLMGQHVKQDAQVVAVLGQILALDPSDDEIAQTLVQKYEKMRRWPDLIGVLEAQAERAEGEARIALKLQLAETYVGKLRNQNEGAKAYEAVLADDPENMQALNALDGMYEKKRDWDNLIATRQRIADLADDPIARLDGYKALAKYAGKKIRKPDIVQRLWEAVRELDPDDADALRALIGAYEQNKDFEALVSTIDLLVDQLDAGREQNDLLLKAGTTLQDRIKDMARAVPVWQRLLENNPRDRRAADYLKKALVELKDWDALEEFYARSDNWNELVRMLEGQVGPQKEDEARIDLLFRSARIYEEQLSQQDRAVKALERVLQIEAGNVTAARQLEPIYTERGDHRKLAGVLGVLLEDESDPTERRLLMLRSAEIAEQHLRDPDGAFAWVRQALGEHPADETARNELVRLGEVTNDWQSVHDDLAAALERIPESAAEDPAQAQLETLLHLGRILDGQLGDNPGALDRYLQALELDPENADALDAVEVLYTRLADWHALLQILDRKLALATDSEVRRELFRKQGVIFEDQLEDAASAIERYRSVLDEDDQDEGALDALRRLYEATEQAPELHEILGRQYQLALDGERADEAVAIRMRVGLIELHHLDRVSDALQNFREILEGDAAHEDARVALEGLLEDPTHRAEAASILEPIYEGSGAWENLAVTLEIQLEETYEAERRVGLLERIGALLVDRLADIERGFEAFARLLQEQPGSEVAIERLTQLAEVADGWEPLSGLIEQVLPEVTEDELARGLLARVAGIYEDRLDHSMMAIDAHRRVLDLEPDDRDSIEALDRLYSRTEQWEELLAIYRRKLELVEEADARQALQFQVANLLENMLEQPRDAIATYGEIVMDDPQNLRALVALDRLYAQEEMWAELAEVLSRQLELADDAAHNIALRVRLGEVNETRLLNYDVAIETYRSILQDDGNNEAAITALERLSEDPSFRAAIADILEPIYIAQDAWQKVIEVYEIQREYSADEQRKVQLLHQIASLHQDRGGDAAEAFRSYARAFRLDPSHADTLAALHRIAAALELWGDLAAVYEEQVDEIPEPEVATDIHKRVAEIQLRRLDDVEGSRGHYEAAYQSDDTDMVVIDALDEIYRQTSQWSELVSVLYRKAELTEEVGERKGLYFQIAGLNETMLDDPYRAIEALTTIRELDPVDGQALDELERLHTVLEQWEDLMEVLQRKAELTEDLEARKRIYYAIGASYESQLDDPHRAIETYNTVLEWDASDMPALQSLDRLFDRLENWDELLGVLGRQVEIVEAIEDKLALRFRMARLHEVNLEQIETAIEGYKGILADEPTHEPSLEALEGLIRQDREARAAADVLEPVLIKGADWGRMIGVWLDLLEVTMDLEARTALRMRIGQAHEDMLTDSESAFAAYGEAFREDPTHGDALEALERVARNAEMWEPLVLLVEDQLINIPSEYIVRDLLLRVARVLEEEMSDAPGAIERFRRVMEIDPDHDGAILALDRLYLRVQQWPELADILELRVERVEGEERVPLLLRLGNLYETMLEEIARAINAYKDVLDITEQQPDAVTSLERLFDGGHDQPTVGEVLEPIYLGNEEWAKLHDLLQALLAHQMPGDERMRSMHRLAELSTEKLDDKARAFLWYGEAFKEVPEDETSRAEVVRLAEEIDAWDNLVAIYTEGLQNTQDLELIRTVSHEMAGIYRQRLENDEMAEQMFQYVLTQIDPADGEALKGLDTLYEEQGRWPELIEVLRREVEITYDEPELLVLMFRLGQLYERQAELDLAIDEYRGILAREPNHPEGLARLEQIYLTREEWEPLYEVYARQAENAEEDAPRAVILASQANIAGQFLDRTMDAVDLWAQVLEIRGEDREALMALEGLYQTQEAWRELVDVCERQINHLDNDQAREMQLYAKLGRVWGDYLEREQNALENWHKVLEFDPQHEDALWAVRALYDRLSEVEQVAVIDHRLLDQLAAEDPRRIDLFRQLGQLYTTELERPDDAIHAWTQLLAQSPYDPEAIEFLEDLYTRSEHWAACVQILERKVEITEDPYDKVSILFSAAEMYEERLADAGGAQQSYQSVLAVQPDNLEAFQQLCRLYEAGEQWEALVELQLGRAEVSQDPAELLDLYQGTALIFEQRLDNIESAFVVLSQAFEASLDDARFGAELARLAEAGEYWSPLIETYQKVIEMLGDVPESVPLRIRVAEWWDGKLEQAEYAATHYQHALTIDPDNVPALTALELLLERYENWPEVVRLLQRKTELVQEPDDTKNTWEKLARILEQYMGQPDEAIDAYRQVLLVDAADLQTLQALERLYSNRMRWQELIDVLTQQTAVLEDQAEVVEKWLVVAELWQSQLGTPERAIDALRSALDVDERCLEAMIALEKLYTQQDRWVELLEVYQLMLGVREEREERLRIFRRVAEIQESEVRDRFATIDAYRQMMEAEPRDPHAVQALDRLYRESEQWDELAEVYAKHLEVLEDPETEVLIRSALAEIYRGPLESPAQAIESLTPILVKSADHRQTLQSLGELYAEVEDWHNCIDVLSREAHLIHDRAELLDRQYRVGRIYQEKLNDLDQAERWFRSALDHDRNFLPALEALKDVNIARGEWPEAIRALQMMEAATKNFAEKSVHLFEIGRIYDKHVNDRTTAIDYYEQAMDMSPDNASAAEPLIDVYWSDNNWARAEPLLDLLLQGQQDADIRELQKLHYRIAYCAEQLRKDDKALTHYRQAYELDSTDLPTLQGMGNLLSRHEDWDRAFKIYQTILVHHRDSLSESDVVRIFHQQGQIKLRLGERRKALDFFRKALDIDPQNTGILQALIELHEGRNDWEDVIHYRRQIAALLEDTQQKFEALVGIADILHEKMNNTRLSVDAYNEALQVKPGSRMVLGKLLALHEEASDWNSMVSVLTQLAEQETNPARKSKYWCGVATIQKEKLKDSFTAVRSFDKGLEADPSNLRAFQAIDQILTEERDYERQDRYYRKMLKRATESNLDENLVFSLAKNLGEINRSRLQRYTEAVKAYKIALSKKPNDEPTHQILAQLYELEDQVDKAIGQHYKVLDLNPRHIESYQHLRRLFMEAGRYDEAWCVCQVLAFLGQASQDERVFFEKYRSRTLRQAQRQLDQRHWALIAHPDKSPILDHLFQRLYAYTLPVISQTHKQLGLHKRRTLLNTQEQTPFNNVMRYVAHTTRLAAPEAHRDPQNRPGLRLAPLNPPCMLIGPDIMSGRKPQELAFASAKQLYLLSQSTFLANLGDTYEQRKMYLTTFIYTLMRLVKPQANVQFDPNLLEEWNRSIPGPDRIEMDKLIQRASANPKVHLNISRWLETVEHTGNRLGLVLANDLGAAVQVIRNEAGSFSRASVEARNRELVLFALSENYFKLRKELGLAIGSNR